MKSKSKGLAIREKGTKLSLSDKIGSSNNEKVVFSFEHLADSGHGLECEPVEFKELIRHLKTVSSMTWQQVQDADRHGLGSEKIPKKEITEEIPPCHADREFFLSFRYSGNKPFVGIRSDRVLDVLYLDPNFDLYRH